MTINSLDHTSRGDENIQGAIFGEDRANHRLGVFGILDVDLMEGNRDTGQLVEFGRSFIANALVHVEEGNRFGTGFGEGVGHVPS